MPDRLQMLRNAMLLESVPEAELSQLAALVRPVELKVAETFAVRGQPSPGMVLVDAGTLEVILDSTPICSLSPGSIFAEEALVSDLPSPATLRAAAPSAIGVLEREAMEGQIDLMPRLWAVLDRAWRHRVLAARLYAIDLFHDLPSEARLSLADAFEEVDLSPGQLLAEEGQPLDSFWVIREGQAELELPPGNDPPSVPLRPGEYVGDLAVVEDFPQSATVSAPYGLRAMRLSRRQLHAALARFPGAMAEVQQAAARRKESIL
ncbi:MAG TPA: cyclic nucleotide-binding domain-containing protein [Myxococcales bacterium]|nr:cyclic nucleotide-binding domain-containing protein [Myxococcales bacterium]